MTIGLLVINSLGEVYCHPLIDGILRSPFQILSESAVASVPHDRFVFCWGSDIVVVNSLGEVYKHPITKGVIRSPYRVPSESPVASVAHDRAVFPWLNGLVVVNTLGEVYCHPFIGGVLRSPYRITSEYPVGAISHDRFVFPWGQELFVTNSKGEVYSHPMIGDVLRSPYRVPSESPVASVAHDRAVFPWLNGLVVVNTLGEVYCHSLTGKILSSPQRVSSEYPVASMSHDRFITRIWVEAEIVLASDQILAASNNFNGLICNGSGRTIWVRPENEKDRKKVDNGKVYVGSVEGYVYREKVWKTPDYNLVVVKGDGTPTCIGSANIRAQWECRGLSKPPDDGWEPLFEQRELNRSAPDSSNNGENDDFDHSRGETRTYEGIDIPSGSLARVGSIA